MSSKTLPPGFTDLIGKAAENNYFILKNFIDSFLASNYRLVSPALFEYQDKQKPAENSIKVIDSLTNEVMVMREDITKQIGRIFRKENQDSAKYCYYGNVFYQNNNELNQARQLTQLGLEAIADASLARDYEIFSLTLDALAKINITDFVIVIALPEIFNQICRLKKINQLEQQKLRSMFFAKNYSALKKSKYNYLAKYVLSSDSDKLAELKNDYPELSPALEEFATLLSKLQKNYPQLEIIVDPFDLRQFRYHTDYVFKIISRQAKQVFARGGAYQIDKKQAAAGVSFYLEELSPLTK